MLLIIISHSNHIIIANKIKYVFVKLFHHINPYVINYSVLHSVDHYIIHFIHTFTLHTDIHSPLMIHIHSLMYSTHKGIFNHISLAYIDLLLNLLHYWHHILSCVLQLDYVTDFHSIISFCKLYFVPVSS